MMQDWLRPSRLREGDLVALISPASPINGCGALEHAQAQLESWGLRVWTGPSADAKNDYLAGTDKQRAADLNQAIRHPQVRAIFGTRGGYGTARLLPLVDFKALRARTKILAGFSDWTALLNACAAKCQLQTLHAPTMYWLMGTEKTAESDSANHLRRLLFSSEPLEELNRAWNWDDAWPMKSGRCTGRLIGGNLTVFSSLVGTEYLPTPKGCVLFLEEVGEPLYRLDRCLTQLRLSGYLSQLDGILLGQFTQCDEEQTPVERDAFERMIARCLHGLSIPIIGNLPVGHLHPSASLPLGGRVKMNGKTGKIALAESFTIDAM